eukprot:NODE_7882_length_405_cov_132.147482_g7716_i0.p1 GENE.NODE_7882_length_405_cov_132.147482_g7716_i0~~NODE_7882_length_405_cov_132.147482_g7716_i0.p1  ORF type:complete len:117 (+),score=26.37 NODE_7882_length_405_cov_132.147482_g7716_i0:54-353(+)
MLKRSNFLHSIVNEGHSAYALQETRIGQPQKGQIVHVVSAGEVKITGNAWRNFWRHAVIKTKKHSILYFPVLVSAGVYYGLFCYCRWVNEQRKWANVEH